MDEVLPFSPCGQNPAQLDKKLVFSDLHDLTRLTATVHNLHFVPHLHGHGPQQLKGLAIGLLFHGFSARLLAFGGFHSLRHQANHSVFDLVASLLCFSFLPTAGPLLQALAPHELIGDGRIVRRGFVEFVFQRLNLLVLCLLQVFQVL